MKNNKRQMRLNDQVKRELAEIIRSGLRDPRIGTVTSVTRAEVTPDLKYCKIYISILGDDKAGVMDGLTSASGYIRKLLAERVNLRQTPELRFIHDDAIEHGLRISRLIDEVIND
ncbi:MAG: 30S ribosome-binding factor RbfA [Defluviitaleaceae bacterium]|nr:30S ribosome-binding factor RbfA [Defluviitaleaceae bacterium]MCL2837122.1 30S ribosome-binding factor RbfA [Defluviitaleaceae bacterium]